MNNITEREAEQYKRLTRLFEKYKDHKFNPFDKVLIYFKYRGVSHEFTIVPILACYFKEVVYLDTRIDENIQVSKKNIMKERFLIL